jgi:hypothetical protein
MNRFTLSAACGLLVACTAVVPASAANSGSIAGQALDINIGGIGPAVDARAYAKVRMLLSEALFSNTIAYFDVAGYGKEGGFSACVEKGMFAAEGSFERLTRSLKAIRVDRSTSFYGVEAVANCSYPVAPVVVPN